MNINKNFSYEVLSQNQILAYVDEEIKILNCDKDIFEEFLSNCNKKQIMNMCKSTLGGLQRMR